MDTLIDRLWQKADLENGVEAYVFRSTIPGKNFGKYLAVLRDLDAEQTVGQQVCASYDVAVTRAKAWIAGTAA